MKLQEWQDAKGNKVTIPNSTSSTTNNNSVSYYKRLRRLLNYHIDHKDNDVDKIVTNDVRNFGLDYIEHHKGQFEGGYFKKVAVRISDTGDWYFTVDLDNKQIANKVGKGWDKLVYEMSFELNLPQVTSDPEYKDLLAEWVDSRGNKVNVNNSTTKANKTNKEKFEELVAYMKKYEAAYTTKMDLDWLNDSGFKINIGRKSPGIKEYTITIEVNYSRFNSSWQFEVYSKLKSIF